MPARECQADSHMNWHNSPPSLKWQGLAVPLLLLAVLVAPMWGLTPEEAMTDDSLGFAPHGEEDVQPPNSLEDVEIVCGGDGKDRTGLPDGEFVAGRTYTLSKPNTDGKSSVVYLDGALNFVVKIPRVTTWLNLGPEAEHSPPASQANIAQKYVPRTYECQLRCGAADAACRERLKDQFVPILGKDKIDGFTLTEIILVLANRGPPTAGRDLQCPHIGAKESFTRTKYRAIKTHQNPRHGLGLALYRKLIGPSRRQQLKAKIEPMLKCMLGTIGLDAFDTKFVYMDVKPDNVMYGKWKGLDNQLALIDFIPLDYTTQTWDDYTTQETIGNILSYDQNWDCAGRFWQQLIQPGFDESRKDTLTKWKTENCAESNFLSSGTSLLRAGPHGGSALRTLDRIYDIVSEELDVIQREEAEQWKGEQGK